MIKLTAFLILFTGCVSEAAYPGNDAGQDAAQDGGADAASPTALYMCRASVCGADHTTTCGCVPVGYVAPQDTACTSTTVTACQTGCGFNGCL